MERLISVMQNSSVKLTSLSSKGGCGCKIGPADLAEVLRTLPPGLADPNLLVGLDTSDDAGVYKLNDTTAIVQTLDFFTPIVNDPYDFGQVAAANAINQRTRDILAQMDIEELHHRELALENGGHALPTPIKHGMRWMANRMKDVAYHL